MAKRKTLYELALTVKKWRDAAANLRRSKMPRRHICAAEASYDRAHTVLAKRAHEITGAWGVAPAVILATHDAHTASIAALEKLYSERNRARDHEDSPYLEGECDGIADALHLIRNLRGDE